MDLYPVYKQIVIKVLRLCYKQGIGSYLIRKRIAIEPWRLCCQQGMGSNLVYKRIAIELQRLCYPQTNSSQTNHSIFVVNKARNRDLSINE